MPPQLPLELLLYIRSPLSTLTRSTVRSLLKTIHIPSRRFAGSEATASQLQETTPDPTPDHDPHLNPPPTDYSANPFTDNCTLTLSTGSGGHGCVSFLREKYIPEGPPNGGNGGTGGSIYIEAVRGETSLHRIARRPILKAGRGGNGKGKGQGGQRGEDVILQVPVGTVVRELSRFDPVEEEWLRRREAKRRGEMTEEVEEDIAREKFVIFPGPLSGRDMANAEQGPPKIPPGAQRPAPYQPLAPIQLDLSSPSRQPVLLAAGALGGLGNPHFVTRESPRPKYATKGTQGMKMQLSLELKTLADVGLVGLPNAGKSTLLRALTRSRTRVGDWAFTTLSPTIGTVVLDDNTGRPELPLIMPRDKQGQREQRRSFTIADIPGLIEDAHLDKGLGLGFLRHIERASVLCFVVDLSRQTVEDPTQGEEERLEAELDARIAGHPDESPHPTNTRSATTSEDSTPLDEDPPDIGQNHATHSPTIPTPLEQNPAVQTLLTLWREVAAYENILAASLSVNTEQRLGPHPPVQPPAEPAPSPNQDPFSTNYQFSTPAAMADIPAPITSKPWFIAATKADLPGTQVNYQALKRFCEGVSRGEKEHPSGRANAWGRGRELRLVPVSAVTGGEGGGVEGVKRVGVGLIGEGG